MVVYGGIESKSKNLKMRKLSDDYKFIEGEEPGA